MRARFLVIAALLIIAQSGAARADDVKAGDLVISEAWSRATPGSAKVASGYLTIANTGTAPDRLLGGSADVAAKVDVHEMAENGGVMRMRTLIDGLALPPGVTITLAPSGYHLMLNDIKQPLKQGDSVPVRLKFERAGEVAVTFKVLGVGARGPGSPLKMAPMDKGDMKMDHSKMKM
jgi:copper(I)-binding protein